MIEVQLQIPDSVNTNALVRVVENICIANGLTCTLKGTLAGYPGCVHWHFRRGRQKGILEMTWWEMEHRLWFKVADHRKATWIEEDLPVLKKKIEQALHNSQDPTH